MKQPDNSVLCFQVMISLVFSVSQLVKDGGLTLRHTSSVSKADSLFKLMDWKTGAHIKDVEKDCGDWEKWFNM